MKILHQFIILFVFIVFSFQLMAQTPQSFSYQAVARDAAGNGILSKQIGIRISVLDNTATGTALYTETHTPTTNNVGLFALEIGKGAPSTGTFNTLDWGTNKKFLKVEMDAAGGTNYTTVGTTELLSVPYALYAEKVNPANLPTDKDQQTLTLTNNNLSISGGNAVTLPTDKDQQTISFSNDSLRISGGNTIKLPFQKDEFDYSLRVRGYENEIKALKGNDDIYYGFNRVYMSTFWFGGEEENITFSASSLPSGVTFQFSDNKNTEPVGSGNDSDIDGRFYVGCNVTAGVYPITVTATSSVTNKVKTKTVNLEIIDAPTYTITTGSGYTTNYTACGEYFYPYYSAGISVSPTNSNFFNAFSLPYGFNGTGGVLIQSIFFTRTSGCSLLTVPLQSRNLIYDETGNIVATVTISGTGTISGADTTKPTITFNLTVNGGTCTTHTVTMSKL